jgi:hypothetical protein
VLSHQVEAHEGPSTIHAEPSAVWLSHFSAVKPIAHVGVADEPTRSGQPVATQYSALQHGSSAPYAQAAAWDRPPSSEWVGTVLRERHGARSLRDAPVRAASAEADGFADDLEAIFEKASRIDE